MELQRGHVELINVTLHPGSRVPAAGHAYSILHLLHSAACKGLILGQQAQRRTETDKGHNARQPSDRTEPPPRPRPHSPCDLYTPLICQGAGGVTLGL